MNSKTLYLNNSRKFLILFIIILISNNLLSQITFERINENTDGVYRKTTLYQNKIYVAGDKFSEELQTSEYFIALLDTNCNEIWRKTYAITHEEFNPRIVITDLVPDTNNNCFYASFQVVYFYNGNTVAYTESYIVKFSENGILQWKHMTRRYTSTNPSNSSQICVNSNGNISYFNPLVQKTSKGGFYISSLSPYGDSLYSINIQIDTINYLIPTRMIYMNNSFYISCMAKDENNKNEAQPCFLKVNENGQVDWLKKYIIIENASLDDGISDLVFRNNSFYILAYFGGCYYTYLIKVDINGNLQYYKSYMNEDNEDDKVYYEIPRTLRFSSSGNIIVGGQRELVIPYRGRPELFFMKIDEVNGDLLNYFSFGTENNSERIRDFTILNSYIYSFNEKWYYDNSHPNPKNRYIIKFDLNGCKEQSLTETTIQNIACDSINVEIILNDRGKNYLWNTGDTSNYITTGINGAYYCSFIDHNNCPTRSDTVLVPGILYPKKKVYLVTSDTYSENNIIVFNQNQNSGIDSVIIFKQNLNSGFYKKIGQLSVYNLNEFIDYNSNTNSESCKYKIGVVDSCGRNIEFDEIHKTILLSGSLTENDFIQLNWNPYEGFPYEYFALERRVSGGEFHAIATVPNNSFSYIDTDPLSGIAEYRIKVRPYEHYIPDSINYQFSISNIMNTSGLGIENLISNSFNIYPNPTNDILIIKSTNNENINSISLIDEYGRLVYKNENLFHKNLKINTIGFHNGLYVLRINDYINYKIIIL